MDRSNCPCVHQIPLLQDSLKGEKYYLQCARCNPRPTAKRLAEPLRNPRFEPRSPGDGESWCLIYKETGTGNFTVGAMPSTEPPSKEAEANQVADTRLGDKEHLRHHLSADTDGNTIRKAKLGNWKSREYATEIEASGKRGRKRPGRFHWLQPHSVSDAIGPTPKPEKKIKESGDRPSDEDKPKKASFFYTPRDENDPRMTRWKCIGWIGTRHWMTVLLFLGMANAYIMRTNMSVAIVAMVNHTALPTNVEPEAVDTCGGKYNHSINKPTHGGDGEFLWDTETQSYILSSFFYGYVITQIPFGMLSKKYGSKYFLGVGMLINSLFGLLVPVAAYGGFWTLILVRFIQGLGEGPIVPCTHALLAKWIPPNERSRMGAFVYAGAQFGTVISMPLSGLLSAYGFAGGWPSIFYVFGLIGTAWSLVFLVFGYEDPESHPRISPGERKYITNSVWGTAGITSPPIPYKAIAQSLPFWAILVAHIGQNYGYETLMTELPTFMKQILHFDIKENGTLSALPYLAMWIFSMIVSFIADWMISTPHFNIGSTRRIINSIGQFCPALALIAASYTGCNPILTVAILTIGMGLNGGIYSGFKVNHLDISPRFAGILMSFTNCTANLAGLLAPVAAGRLIHGRPTQQAWREVFFIAAGVYLFCGLFYAIFMSGERQSWDDPSRDSNAGDTESGTMPPQSSQKRNGVNATTTVQETRQ